MPSPFDNADEIEEANAARRFVDPTDLETLVDHDVDGSRGRQHQPDHPNRKPV